MNIALVSRVGVWSRALYVVNHVSWVACCELWVTCRALCVACCQL